ncbi:hypothetical protein HDU87_000707 [Geranomyces variabilis]|uniref:Uncharacterized protein n=1 Tax=Geranomyces variabilis TaxID=109894 RepID=A0AAD5TN33_9FUNG|nr:hypothetical protein HDU87_000707 [Geranomyces variabilis]
MRLFLLPVTRAGLRTTTPLPSHLIHHLQLSRTSPYSPPPPTSSSSSASADDASATKPTTSASSNSDASHQAPFIPRMVIKGVTWSTGKWDAMGKKADGSITRRLHTLGEGLKDWVDADEWFLKSIPGVTEVDWARVSKSNGPPPPRQASSAAPPPIASPRPPPPPPTAGEPESADRLPQPPLSSSARDELIKVPVHHATGTSPTHLETHLSDMITTRKTYHKRHLTLSICTLPFSCLFMILPGPNVPLAWNLFRLYSHWRALQGAHTLARIKDANAFIFVPDTAVDHHLAHWEKGHDKEEYMPFDVVAALQDRGTVGEDFGKEVARKVKQLKKRRANQGIVIGTLNKKI